MIAIRKQSITSNHLLKVSALIFGYAFWLILAQNQNIMLTQTIPLSFYMPQNKSNITAPTEITIGITGKRIDLQRLDFNNLGAHIDTSDITQPGVYEIQILPEHIFLPNSVKLVHYSPVMVNLELS